MALDVKCSCLMDLHYFLQEVKSHNVGIYVGIYVEGLFSAITGNRSVVDIGSFYKVTPNSGIKSFAIAPSELPVGTESHFLLSLLKGGKLD